MMTEAKNILIPDGSFKIPQPHVRGKHLVIIPRIRRLIFAKQGNVVLFVMATLVMKPHKYRYVADLTYFLEIISRNNTFIQLLVNS